MQADTEEDTGASRGLNSRPGWLRTMASKNPYVGSSGGYASRNEFDTRPQQRNVNAGRAAPAQAPPAQPPARTAAPPVVPQAVPAPTQQRAVNAGRTGTINGQQPPPFFAHQQGPTNRMDIANPEFYAFLQEARNHADFTTGTLYHMAGHEMSAPQELNWGGRY
jgi:hypothetical protein